MGGPHDVTHTGPVASAAGLATWSQVVWGGQRAACLSGVGVGGWGGGASLVKYPTEPTGVKARQVQGEGQPSMVLELAGARLPSRRHLLPEGW